MKVNRAYNIKLKGENIVYSVVMTIIAGIFINIGLGLMVLYADQSYGYIGILLFILCAVFGFILLPQFITNRIYGKYFLSLNREMINIKRAIILGIIILSAGLYIGGLKKTIFFLLIAVCEEYLFRHIIFKVLSNENSVFWAVILGSVIFATILHSNYNIIDNLLVRMPFSLLFYFVAIKYKLQDAIAFHWIYNILVTTL